MLLIRVQAAVRNQVLSAICREDTVLLPALLQSSILFRQKVIPEAAAAVFLRVDLQADLHTAEALLPADQEVHFLPDLLQVHPVDLPPPLILREAEDNSVDIWFPLDSSFFNRSAGIVFLKMNKL